MCIGCFRNSVDITEGIPKEATLNSCRSSSLQKLSYALFNRDSLSISEKKDELDFFYADRFSAIKKTECLNECRAHQSRQLDPFDGPITSQHIEATAPVHWRNPFDSLATLPDLVEFIVLDIEPAGPFSGKFILADDQVVRSSGFRATAGDEDGMDGDHNTKAFETIDHSRTPDVVCCKDLSPQTKEIQAPNWKLKPIAVEADDMAHPAGGVGRRGALGRRGNVDSQTVEKDYEHFLRDLEGDSKLRSAVTIYKAEHPVAYVNMTAGSG
ncbi:hypothetical protein QFC19_001043 [Naganishia cerealis]|uniref:Uncharacterized protein n=1 Tax=Naganishia cerealis TaxID=610337 RepID=A0ACC2WIZ0_9TREE|nr:hypothetical protein QFC19_001043 [Naganishia cerealis]